VAKKRLAELVAEREREAAGLIAPKLERDAATRLLKDHLEDWLETKERTRDDQYLVGVRNRVVRLIKECRWTYAKDVKAEDYALWVSGSNLSPKTLNDFLVSIRTLLNWMVKQGRLGANPLRSLDLLPANEDKRRPRRALTDEELGRLLKKSGERGIAYLVAVTTGLRLGELREVERRDIRLNDASPKIVARAATTKNRKEASLPLHRDVAVQLRAFLAGCEIEADEKVFEPLLRLRGQFKSDLCAAGIPPKDDQGRVVDFHSLRHTFCTNLQRLNVPLRVIMLMMRHSDRRLSDQTYTDTSLLPADETVQLLTVPGGTPSHDLSHIASHDLVPAGQNGSHAVTTPRMPNGAETLMNTRDCHDLALSVTPGQKIQMVRDTGFEPVTPTVSSWGPALVGNISAVTSSFRAVTKLSATVRYGGLKMRGAGFEPATSCVSGRRSTPELTALKNGGLWA